MSLCSLSKLTNLSVLTECRHVTMQDVGLVNCLVDQKVEQEVLQLSKAP
jgi:hypothetical protein